MAIARPRAGRWRRGGRTGVPAPAPPTEGLVRSGEHAAGLEDPGRFDSLHGRDGFFDDGVGAIFGVRAGTAELQSLCFRPATFTPAGARRWLRDRGFKPLLFVEGDLP